MTRRAKTGHSCGYAEGVLSAVTQLALRDARGFEFNYLQSVRIAPMTIMLTKR
jgi:hypothetical protein